MWFYTLNYANGPGHFDHEMPGGGRMNPRGSNYMDPRFRQPAMVPKDEETHAGEDVGVYASGPYSHVRSSSTFWVNEINFFFQIFSGVYEQSYIAHAMSYATCLGPEDFLKNPICFETTSTPEEGTTTPGAATVNFSSSILLVSLYSAKLIIT